MAAQSRLFNALRIKVVLGGRFRLYGGDLEERQKKRTHSYPHPPQQQP